MDELGTCALEDDAQVNGGCHILRRVGRVKKRIKIKREGRKKRLWQKEDSRYAAIVERVRRS